MRFIETELPGVILIEPDVHRDDRGFFLETYQETRYAEGGIRVSFVQDNFSRSTRNTLRGLHGQTQRPQGKLLRVAHGAVLDVAVDVRRGSPHFGQWVSAELSHENFRQLYVPPGFAHGFCVLSESADLSYKCTDFYDGADEYAIAWNDPDIGISWPVTDPILSARDAAAPRLKELDEELPRYEKD